MAQDGQQALTRLMDIVPDVVVLDLHLPHVSGKDILSQIRQDDRLINIPVIVATADPIAAESLRNDTNLILIKPISFTRLRDLASQLRSHNVG